MSEVDFFLLKTTVSFRWHWGLVDTWSEDGCQHVIWKCVYCKKIECFVIKCLNNLQHGVTIEPRL